MNDTKAAPKRFAGLDLGGTKIEAVVVDSRNTVLGSARRPTPTEGGPPQVAEALVQSVREAAEAAKTDVRHLQSVGVGSPGLVDPKTGAVSSARNLPDWEGSFELGATLREQLGAPAAVGNDVQVAVNAEFELGAGKPYRSLLGVFWGTGVGGGIILNGRPWLGRGGAGEVGHVVVEPDGARCGCGRRGCMEAYAGRAAMEARARRRVEKGHKTDLFKLMEHRGKTRLTSAVWARALEHGDEMAHELIGKAIWAIGIGVASAINVLDVEAVIIGGGLGVRFGQPFAERIAKAMAPHVFNDAHPPEVKVAGLGDQGGAIGAALLGRSAL